MKISCLPQWIRSLIDSGIKFTILRDFVPFAQKGQTCKLVAGSSVQHYLYQNQYHSIPPLPLHKQKTGQYSLRKRAKVLIDSKVGEVYGASQIKTVFEYDDFAVDSFRIYDEEVYIKFIKNSLKHLCPVIVFFDVIPRRDEIPDSGAPALLNGEFEHAAVIVGIYKKDVTYHVVYAQWGGFYECPVNNLFNSTSQLKIDKSSEDYKKFDAIRFVLPEPAWISDQQAQNMLETFYDAMPFRKYIYSHLHTFFRSRIENDPARNRIANPPKGLEGSLANTVTVITGDKMDRDFLTKYNEIVFDLI